ncbi:Phage-related protein [Desulfitobacterium hafniense]|uniref:Phage-related protein n=1 Tax=Desulfitobacterium hafniense TaxID=49338 RepID=A0A098AUW1_DESHA|nr:siphovirus ReqiPepy6 Gp37-like family protein [Desulfitobacterium hafniense]CDV96346.1 Phage-related protein [Desulfitobacterium hafniense]
MELYVFDKDLNHLGLVEGFFSLRWIRRYSKCGEFELQCGLTPSTLSLLQRGNIIWKNDDTEAGYIEYRNITLNALKEEVLVVSGKFLTGYLGRRIIWGTERIYGTAEVAIRTLVYNHAINPSNTDRIIPLLELGDLKGYEQEISKQSSYSNLLDTIENIATASELGLRTMPDIVNKALVFDIYEGLDRTAGQTENAPAIFASEFENILEQEYTDSLNNYRNVVLVGGAGEGVERKLVTVGVGEGLERFELFADRRDMSNIDDDNNPIPDEDYLPMLEQKGLEILAENTEVKTFTSKVNLNSNLTYKDDFDLGDKVTCFNRRWGLTIDTRITEVEEVYDLKGKEIFVTFGNSIPTLIDKIRQAVKR